MRRFDRSRTTLYFDPGESPIGELRPGERTLVETADSICGLGKALAPRGIHIDDLVDRLGGACPLTGPFWVEGARPGDRLEVELHSVTADPEEGEAWTGIFGGFGALDHEAYSLASGPEPEIRMVPYREGVAHFPARKGEVEVPLDPFLGTVGVAPARERRLTFSQSPEYLGDVDVPAIRGGATLVLPVNVEGALLAFGDAHGAQGNGEITGAAIEIEAVVELSVNVRSADRPGYFGLPQINTREWIGSVAGFEGVSLADCARAAYRDLILRMTNGYDFTPSDAYQLLSQVGRLEVGNMIDPFYSAMARVDRRFLE